MTWGIPKIRRRILETAIFFSCAFFMNTPLSYKDAGVDIDAGEALVERIKPLARKTLRDGVLGGIGGFGALFEVPGKFREPVLVSGTDGVGSTTTVCCFPSSRNSIFLIARRCKVPL